MGFPVNLLCALLSVTLFASPLGLLRIQEGAGGRDLGALRVKEGDRVHVEYAHSMYHVKQRETYSIGPDLRFHLEEVTFGSYAAALYYSAEGVNYRDGLWTIKGAGQDYAALRYRVGPGTGHVVILDEERLEMCAGSECQGFLIELRVERPEAD